MKLNPRIMMLGLTATLLSTSSAILAQTVISGPSILTSTWTPLGSPYILTADCAVPSGQTLSIQPGTTIWMGSGTSLTGNGIIHAVGTAAQPITFEPPVSSQMWNTIIINNTAGTNQFKYCEFYNATNALDFRGASKNEVVYCIFSNMVTCITLRDASLNTINNCSIESATNGIWLSVFPSGLVGATWVQSTALLNCSLKSCSGQSIYGEAIGYQYSTVYQRSDAYLNFVMKSCSLSNSVTGCRFVVSGVRAVNGVGYGSAALQVMNNIFHNITSNVVMMSIAGLGYASSTSSVINNTIVGAGNGIITQDPWDTRVQNNVFKSCGTAVTRSGSFSATVSYNDFFANTANFSGYPVTYGQVILANRNGTPCDVLFNIFSDPMFVSASDFHLQPGSPCIDAGEGSGANLDSYFPPSMGSVTNDIGAYGGPNAGQWIVPASTNAFLLGITKIPYVSVTVNPPEPGNYRLEYASALLGTNTWIQITNLPLTTLPFTNTEPAVVPARYYRAVKQ